MSHSKHFICRRWPNLILIWLHPIFRLQWQFWATWRRPLHLLIMFGPVCWRWMLGVGLSPMNWRLVDVMMDGTPSLHICDCKVHPSCFTPPPYCQTTFVFSARKAHGVQTYPWCLPLQLPSIISHWIVELMKPKPMDFPLVKPNIRPTMWKFPSKHAFASFSHQMPCLWSNRFAIAHVICQ